MVEKSSVAPQGATHRYEHGGIISWYREAADNLFVWRDGSWHGSAFKGAEQLMESCPLGLVTMLGFEKAEHPEPAEYYLTLLERNVHNLSKFGDARISKVGDEVVWSLPSSPPDSYTFTKDEWLTRRADLQNKPSWESLPEWAEHLAQDECGEWLAFRHIPECKSKEWDSGSSAFNHTGWKLGEVLGDWRDTLERWPADLSEQAVTERLADATKTALAAATALMDEKYRFNRNDWHERGELPPVGIECEILSNGRWASVFIIGVNRAGKLIAEFPHGDLVLCENMEFRPIRTERHELINIITANLSGTAGQVADAILADGFKRGV